MSTSDVKFGKTEAFKKSMSFYGKIHEDIHISGMSPLTCSLVAQN